MIFDYEKSLFAWKQLKTVVFVYKGGVFPAGVNLSLNPIGHMSNK